MKTILLLAILLFSSLAQAVYAEGPVQGTPFDDFPKAIKSSSLPAENTQQSAIAEADRMTHEFRMTQEKNKLYECIILSVAMVVCLLIALSTLRKSASFTAGNILNSIGLILIVYGTIYVVVLSDTEQQMTATVGILGAIAGYLFGTMEKGRSRPEKPTAP